MRSLLIFAAGLLLGAIAGLALGWQWYSAEVDGNPDQIIAEKTATQSAPARSPHASQAGPRQTTDSEGPTDFRQQMDQSILLLGQQRFEQAFSSMLSASLLVSNFSQQDEFERWLARLMDEYSRALVALNQYEQVDQLFEQLTLALPQLGEYQLQLGKLRISMGNAEAALQPLAQVSNHEKLGVEARALIAQIEASISAPIAVETLPITALSGQFIIDAILDDRVPLRLLIDTGAAMTAIDARVLRRAGYKLDGDQQYFVTANGVVQAPVITAAAFALGEARRTDIAIGALALELPDQVDGLLGMNFLRHYEFKIDQNNGLLILDKR